MKQFDDNFKEQINNAFDSYNADHLADSAWNSFHQKKSKTRWLGLIIPLWAKAASVAILLSIGGFITYKALENQQNTELARVMMIDTTQTAGPLHKNPTIRKELVPKTIKEPLVTSKKRTINVVEQSTETVDILQSRDIVAEVVEPRILDSTLAEINSGKNDVNNLTTTTNDSIEVNYENPVVIQKGTTLLAFKEPEAEIKKAKKTSFFAGLSGIMASIGDMVSSSPGVSVGVYAEHKLTNRISIRPGLALAKHAYEMQSISNGNDYMFSAPTMNGMSGDVLSAETSMDIVAMEIPINIVFNISEKNRSKLFVSAGASTMVYLNQHFSGTLHNVYRTENIDSSTGEISIETNYTTTNIEDEYGAFSRVDYFGLANLSAGYSFPIGKTNTMLVEPFIQLPMHDITSTNLRIRYGGLSLKFRFGK
ncbi:MAG: outer membrane beta-barrel protein [Bacteroidales bacterium]|nr:outer membrane beta-barrel protein [Bacteroidales bacterium]MDD4385428.1 outer membrane beta-barrel protein [Bacteroidales bacterium]